MSRRDLLRKEHQGEADKIGLSLGAFIGNGASRTVYELEGRPDQVVKVALDRKARHNRTEWHVWHEAAPEEVKQFLLPPLKLLGARGEFLVMPKGAPVKGGRSRLPKDGLYVVSDNNLDNWVEYMDRVLICDYSENRLAKRLGLTWRKM